MTAPRGSSRPCIAMQRAFCLKVHRQTSNAATALSRVLLAEFINEYTYTASPSNLHRAHTLRPARALLIPLRCHLCF
jgi:hypothetical protein